LLPPVIKPFLDSVLGGETVNAVPLSEGLQQGIASLYATQPAVVALVGVGVSIVGIVFVGLAGMSKEGELSEEEKKKAVAEFAFKKGILIALFSGIMSAALSLGLNGGAKIEELASTIEPVTGPAWKGMPVLAIALLGGFTVNFLWCLFLNIKNKTTGDYCKKNAPIIGNLIFAGIAGVIWCSQFICFKTGQPAMGDQAYIGWAVLMASAILFSSLLGILLGEWKGTSKRTVSFLVTGLLLLVLSSVISGYSGYLKEETPAEPVSVVMEIGQNG
jgi:L-rhamnose-H+ transport protein